MKKIFLLKITNMKYISIAILAGTLMTAAQCSPTSDKKAGAEVQTKAASEKTLKQVAADGALIVDVRTPEEFAAGSYPGAINIPLEEVATRTSEFKNDKGVILFCRTGNRSGQAIEILNQNGITNTYNGINTETLERELK